MEKLQCDISNLVELVCFGRLFRGRMCWESKIEVLLGVLGVGSNCDTLAGRVEEQVWEEWKNGFRLEYVTCVWDS